MRQIFLLIVVVLLFAATVPAGTEHAVSGKSHRYYNGVVPTSTDALIGGTVYLCDLTFTNTSTTTADTITVTDRSTDCSSTVCKILSTVSIEASTTYQITFNAQQMYGGINWVSANGTVHGKAHYSTTPTCQN